MPHSLLKLGSVAQPANVMKPGETTGLPESPGPVCQSSTEQQLQQHQSRKEIRGSHAPDPGPDGILVKPFALLERIHDVGLHAPVVTFPRESLEGLRFD